MLDNFVSIKHVVHLLKGCFKEDTLTLLFYGLIQLASFRGMNLSWVGRTKTAFFFPDRAHRDLQFETHPKAIALR